MALLSSSLSFNRKITDNYIATYLAGEGIEFTKNILDHNVMLVNGFPSSTPPIAPCTTCAWNDGFAGGGDFEADYQGQQLSPYTGQPLLLDPGGQGYVYGLGDTTSFVRKVRIDEICRNGQVRIAPLSCVGGGNPPVGILVKSTVTWSTGLFGSEINLEGRFYNWRT